MASLIKRAWYQDSIAAFGRMGAEDVVNKLSGRSSFDVTLEQKQAWGRTVELLQPALAGMQGRIYFEFEIPRMGSRADVVLFMQGRLLVLEFKAGPQVFPRGQPRTAGGADAGRDRGAAGW
ncbi:MAG: hypothetical protein ISN26_03150 [Betaproteobacteria bacterium AqS2]|uniref:Uncharacterized protein n=1 Tax=Candidatus Amphirhobacter heronislandensis TaxID=1732024 RepID=A0A930UCJ6_9GAMM|nr:hypothetical protein [Betaproteobacteria bacterium AqS2]